MLKCFLYIHILSTENESGKIIVSCVTDIYCCIEFQNMESYKVAINDWFYVEVCVKYNSLFQMGNGNEKAGRPMINVRIKFPVLLTALVVTNNIFY